MANKLTLTDTIFWTKRFGTVLGIGVGLIIFIRIVIAIIAGPNPEGSKYLVANEACPTNIPEITLTSLPLATGAQPEIKLETPDGRLPDLPGVVNVYRFGHPGQSLNALEEATAIADELGFPAANRRKITDTDYQWKDVNSERQLDVNLDNLNFFISRDFSEPLPIVAGTDAPLPSEEEAVNTAYRWLLNLGLADQDISEENVKVSFLKIVDGRLNLISSRQEADLVRVDFFRNEDLIYIENNLGEAVNLGNAVREQLIEEQGSDPATGQSTDVLRFETDIVTSNPDKANISLTINGKELNSTEGSINLWSMEYFNWRLPPKSCGTYQLITPSEAFEKTKAGEGYLTKVEKKFGGDPFSPYTPEVLKEIVILDIKLVYLDSRGKQEYLQPVYQLTGDGVLGDNTKADVVFYVPAVIDTETIPPGGNLETETGSESL